jgi:Flp pilus assembly protein TadD
LEPNDIGALFQLGLLQYRNGAYESAVIPFERAILLSPDYANAKYFLGLTYEKLGRVNEAIVLFENLALTNPESTDVASILSNLKSGIPAVSGMETLPEDEEDVPLEE